MGIQQYLILPILLVVKRQTASLCSDLGFLTFFQFNNFQNLQLHHVTMVESQWGQRGGPWEFNLRDLFRWCDLMVHDQWGHGEVKGHRWDPGQHVGLIYRERLRTALDKEKVGLGRSKPCFH